jgi:hypothetical protein
VHDLEAEEYPPPGSYFPAGQLQHEQVQSRVQPLPQSHEPQYLFFFHVLCWWRWFVVVVVLEEELIEKKTDPTKMKQ